VLFSHLLERFGVTGGKKSAVAMEKGIKPDEKPMSLIDDGVHQLRLQLEQCIASNDQLRQKLEDCARNQHSTRCAACRRQLVNYQQPPGGGHRGLKLLICQIIASVTFTLTLVSSCRTVTGL